MIILFVDSDHESSEAMMTKFTAMSFPRNFPKHIINVNQDCPVCQFFGIKEAPVVAVIRGGSLFAMIEDCDQESCQWLMEFTQKQLDVFGIN
jgi:hypothetical protein